MEISELPIRYHCRSCGPFERSLSLRSYPVKCPNCQKETTTNGFQSFKTVQIYVSEPASYNILNPNDKQCQVRIITGSAQFSFLTVETFYDEFEQSDDILSDLISFKPKISYSKRELYDKFLAGEIIPNVELFTINRKKNQKEQLLIDIYKKYAEYKDVCSDLEELCGLD